jgi:hypothetical protein
LLLHQKIGFFQDRITLVIPAGQMKNHPFVHQIEKAIFTSIVVFGPLNQCHSPVRIARFETAVDPSIMGKRSTTSC